MIADGFEEALDRQRPVQDEGHLGARRRRSRWRRSPTSRARCPRSTAITCKIYQDQQARSTPTWWPATSTYRPQIPIESLGSAAERPRRPLPEEPELRPSRSSASRRSRRSSPTSNVRRALSMAINRKEMTDQIFLGSQTPATSFVSPVVAGLPRRHLRRELRRTTPPRPSSCTPRPVARRPSRSRTTWTAATRPGWTRCATRSRRRSGINCTGSRRAEVSPTC